MLKDLCRQTYKSKRMSLSNQTRSAYDEALCRHLQVIDWSAISAVHVFTPIIKHNEPNILNHVEFLREYYPQINIVVSKTDFIYNTMEHYLWDSSTVFEENKWGVFEPIEGRAFDEQEIDLIIIPLLVADKKGNRVGYGKGFYDRFLRSCRIDVIKVGISYFEPIETISDVSDWDVPLDMLVTPLGVNLF